MKKFILFLIFLLILFNVKNSYAIYDPLTTPNNRFGIHVIDENDLQDAAKLVNSSGGDWGYVAIVIREDDRNIQKWQTIFEKFRELHLIPLVRLATRVENAAWIKPRKEDIGSWADFLNSLNWVIENRYIILFNETNHAKEWGNELAPSEYVAFVKEFSEKLKAKSADFFIIQAGLDASAPNSQDTMDETVYLEKMFETDKNWLNYIDGWSSHSYPNPGFVGNPSSIGRGTVKTYLWEKQILQNYGLTKQLPVFITETGWKHSMGRQIDRNLPSPQIAANNYITAFTSVWTDNQIVAVSPFLLNYQDYPFDHFSFKMLDTNQFYPAYEAINQISKNAGKPKQLINANFVNPFLPEKLVKHSQYAFEIDIENKGQAVIDGDDGWKVEITGLPKNFKIDISKIEKTSPFQRTRVKINIESPDSSGKYNYQILLLKDDKIIDKLENNLYIIPPPELMLNSYEWFNKLAQGNDFKLLIYDENQKLVVEKNFVTFTKGLAEITGLYNVVPGKKYRVVLIKTNYLPRQSIVVISETKTAVTFNKLLPFDPSNDGKFTIGDLILLIKRPISSFRLLLGF